MCTTVSGFWVSHSTVQSLNSVWINCRTRSSVSRSTQGRGSSTSRIRTFASRALAKQSSLLWPKLSQHRSRNISLITTTCLLCQYIKVAIEKTILFHEVIKQCDGPDLDSWLIPAGTWIISGCSKILSSLIAFTYLGALFSETRNMYQ